MNKNTSLDDICRDELEYAKKETTRVQDESKQKKYVGTVHKYTKSELDSVLQNQKGRINQADKDHEKGLAQDQVTPQQRNEFIGDRNAAKRAVEKAEEDLNKRPPTSVERIGAGLGSVIGKIGKEATKALPRKRDDD
jgi:hypothetical protein